MVDTPTLGQLRHDTQARTAVQPQSHDEDWRAVDLSALNTTPVGQGASSHPALAGLSTIILGADGAQGEGLVSASAETAIPPALAAVVAAGDVSASWAAATQTHTLTLSGARGLILSGGAHHLLLRVPRAASAELTVVWQPASEGRILAGITIELAEGAQLKVCEYESQAQDAVLISHRLAVLPRDAQLQWYQAGQGGRLVRHAWHVELTAPGASADLGAAVNLDGKRQAHQHLRVAHRAAHTRSSQTFRSVCGGESRYSFDGLVRIDPGCPEADAQQHSGNLQLSKQARIYARPQLDIHTDAVTAAHGCTIGQPDPLERFYLRSRGLSGETADRLIIRGFLADILHRFHHPALAQHAESQLLSA